MAAGYIVVLGLIGALLVLTYKAKDYIVEFRDGLSFIQSSLA